MEEINKKRTFGSFVEEYYPSAVGFCASAIVYLYGIYFFEASYFFSWHIDSLYSSIFNLFVFISPFLFAYYTYIKTIDNSHVSYIRETLYFKRAEGYMLRAIVVTFFTAIASIPVVVINPQPLEMDFLFYSILVWFGFIGYSIALSVRSLYNFTCLLEISFPENFNS